MTPSSTCIWDVLTKTAEMNDVNYVVTTAVNPVSVAPSFIKSVVNCQLVQKLFFLDKPTNTWVDYSTAPASYPFATFASGLNALNTNVGQLTVSATWSAGAVYWKPFKQYRAKITLEDQNGNGLQILSYEFDLELRDVCADNTLAKTAELSPLTTYVIGSGPTTLTPAFTNAQVAQGCASIATLEIVDAITNNYIAVTTPTAGTNFEFITAFGLSDGVLTVDTNNVAKYAIQKSFYLRITITLPDSVSPSKT